MMHLVIPEFINDLMRLELRQDEAVFMLSFVNDEGPLGGIITTGHSHILAIVHATELGLNPGGEVMTVGPFPANSFPAAWCDRLLTSDEMDLVPEPDEWTP